MIACWAGSSVYDALVRQPSQIQRRLLGGEIASLSRLEKFEPDVSGYGDATFRWQYRLEPRQLRDFRSRCKPNGRCILDRDETEADSEAISAALYQDRLWLEKYWY
jgi:hypothetical protein